MAVKTYPYSFHVALDGNGLNGLEGRAGVCIFRYDPADGSYAYKVSYFSGLAGGHAVSVSPDRLCGFLGSTGQHLFLYDPATLDELDRISTLRFEVADHSIKASTHVVWLDDSEFVTAIGEHLWLFDIDRLDKPDRIASHGLKLPHAMKATASGRYIVYGGMDHPDRGEAREVGILDTLTGDTRRVALPTTCWHVAAHPRRDVFYALSFRVSAQHGRDWHEWAMSCFKEYAYEIDAGSGEILRHWAAGQEVPAHINSDVTVSDRELIFCTGGSQSIVFIDLDDFASYRILDERPDAFTQLRHARAAASQIVDCLTRGSPVTSGQHFLRALRVSRGSLLDSVYACQLSADQSLLFTANRGLNRITVYDYPSLRVRSQVPMPPLHSFDGRLPGWADPRLGFHHSYLIGPAPPG